MLYTHMATVGINGLSDHRSLNSLRYTGYGNILKRIQQERQLSQTDLASAGTVNFEVNVMVIQGQSNSLISMLFCAV